MVSYKVIISPKALSQLEQCVDYVHYKLKNRIAAESILRDVHNTRQELLVVAGSLKLCEHPSLRAKGYRAIRLQRHDYVLLYRTEGSNAYVEGFYHLTQDYENLFSSDL